MHMAQIHEEDTESLCLPLVFEIQADYSKHPRTTNGFVAFRRRGKDPQDNDKLKEIFPLDTSSVSTDTTIDAIFSTYTRTREPLSLLDATYINDFSQKRLNDFTRLTKQIKELESSIYDQCRIIAQLCRDAAQKQNDIMVAKCLKSPIRSLPSEILGIIFEMCLPEAEWKVTASTAPLLLCQVCKVWRDVALETSALWDSVCLDIKTWGRSSVGNWCNLLVLLSQRARTRPLNLEIRDMPGNAWTERWSTQLLKILPDFFPKCRTLDLVVSTRHWYDSLLQMEVNDSTFQKLEELSLFIKHQYIDHRQPTNTISLPSFDLFKTAPKLETVTLDVRHPRAVASIDLPYCQLLSLVYRIILRYPFGGSYPIIIWQYILSLCIKLDTAVLTILRDPGDYSSDMILRRRDNHQFFKSFLLDLSITNELDGDVAVIFQNLSTPCLSSLTFEAVSICQILSDPDEEPSMKMYFKIDNLRSAIFNELTFLALFRVHIDDHQLLSLFQALPNVRSLALLNLRKCECCKSQLTPQDSAIVQTLTVPPLDRTEVEKGEFLLPHLCSLELYYTCHDNNPDERTARATAYADLVRSRADVCLKRDNGVGVNDVIYCFHLHLNFSRCYDTQKQMEDIRRRITSVGTVGCPVCVVAELIDDIEWDVVRKEDYELVYN